MALPPEFAFDHALQLPSCTLSGQIQIRRLVSHRYGLATFEAGFHQAPLVVAAGFVAILIAEMHFNTCDVLAETAEDAFYRAYPVVTDTH
ncbi:MAG: hypothetical protein R6W97_08850 [Thiobacillus sp.]